MDRIVALIVALIAVPALAVPSAATQPRALLEAIVQPITTEVGYRDGAVEVNEGSGFVVGDRFYTVYHNISSQPGRAVASRTIRVAGVEITPMYADPEMDLAVFALPPALCARLCNELFLESHGVALGEDVLWLRKLDDARIWSVAQVQNLAFKSATASAVSDCRANMVAEIDLPFVPGTSGGPVINARTGEIMGLIQGSFARSDGTERGYFKPTACLPYVSTASG